ncbi:MAG: pyruvate ferredoxin oxidoreductase [Candidatus Bathyarchaeota archaeon]|nr:MAG: pyruvate ferredoxin oxidoreductase [Candidatus Bathyarchaeota archaeon]
MVHKIVKSSINSSTSTPPTVKKQEIVGLTGDEAAAFAAKQSVVDVVAAYPITPQTIIVEKFSEYVANGETETEFVCVESEHSAMSACVGASLTGARVFTATASQGLALMHEVLYNASGMRCPIVLANANRALSAPINIHCDHSDIMGSRDCGWIQIFAENAQEVYDWILQAFKIGENSKVQLPVVVNLDGFTLTHTFEDLVVFDDEDVKQLLQERVPQIVLDPSNPMTLGGLALPPYYFEVKKQQDAALRGSLSVIDEVVEEYYQMSGRKYGVLEAFEMDDAEAAILCLGSTSGTVRSVVRKMRDEGKKVGLIKLWLYRPFPIDEFLTATKNLKALAVLDRAISFGAPAGPLCSDVTALLQNRGSPLKVFNVIYSIGGRNLTVAEIEGILDEALETGSTGIVTEYVKFMGVRE